MPHTDTVPRVHYWQEGDSGPRVLLVMGFGMRGEMWRPQLDGLRQACRVVAFDNRGIGDSETDATPGSMQVFASDTLRVLDALAWRDSVHLIGVSMGGMIAQHVALAEPTRFRSLCLIATHYGGRLAWFPKFAGIGSMLVGKLPWVKDYGAPLARVLYPREFLRSVEPAALRTRLQAQFSVPAPRQVVREQFRAVRGHCTRDRLHTLTLPTLVVKPGRDVLCRPAHSDRLRNAIPGASLHEIKHAGHGIIFQSAAELNETLLGFIRLHA